MYLSVLLIRIAIAKVHLPDTSSMAWLRAVNYLCRAQFLAATARGMLEAAQVDSETWLLTFSNV